MRRGLQIVLAILSLIPLTFAVLGLANGASYHMPDGGYPASLDNQLRYLSGVYLLVAFLIWYAIPKIERHGRLLTFICVALVIGGLGRLLSHFTIGPAQSAQVAGMILELGSPLLLIWHAAVARSSNAD